MNLLTLQRYVQEVAGRVAAGRRLEKHVKCSRPDLEHDAAFSAEDIACVLLHGRGALAPLAMARDVAVSTPKRANDVGYVYNLFQAGGI